MVGDVADPLGQHCRYQACMNEHQKLMVASGDATIRHLHARTVTLVNTFDQPVSNYRNWKIFSGTLVQISDRLFVATVSHEIDNFESPSQYRLTTIDGHYYDQSADVFIKTIATDYDRPDVGLMELDIEMFDSFSTSIPIGLERISISPPEGQISTLIGTPSRTVSIHPFDDEKWGIAGTLSGFTTGAIDIADWPKLNTKNPLDDKIDMLVKYPDNSPDIRDSTGSHTTLPDPRGISGGGLWPHGLGTSTLWTPENALLTGIQASWFSDIGYVRLTRIFHWLKLVFDNYPELRPELESQFGDVFRMA